ncbi:HTTM domain-containing protein [Kordia zhangzhouensis]|uniref:HTTM domain-containing protein n=1 Tax=Kordia zhangzhouensis TaxID=1620405 RepID=UPI00062971E6|nr:HTTM domain-containing protein [Kordia zhangzhouensis]
MKKTIDIFVFGKTKTLKKEWAIKAIALFSAINVLFIVPDLFYIFGEQGILQQAVNERYIFWYQPVLGWFADIFGYVGISYNATFLIFLAMYMLSLACLWFNFKRPVFAVLSWFIHFMFVNSTYLFSYGADYFVSFMLFMNILICAGYLFKKEHRGALYSFAIRFLQLHLCLVYFFAGIGKLLGTDWLDGNAIWMVINTYTSSTIADGSTAMVAYPIIFKILAWGTVILELLYPILIYSKQTRKVTLVLVLMLHAGIGIFMQFYIFAVLMMLLNIIAFGHYFKWKPSLQEETTKSKASSTKIVYS